MPPHFGGLWKADPKSMKYYIHRTLVHFCLSYCESCNTIFGQIYFTVLPFKYLPEKGYKA
jgi:hypothetical protein